MTHVNIGVVIAAFCCILKKAFLFEVSFSLSQDLWVSCHITRNMAFKLLSFALVIICVWDMAENAGDCPPLHYIWWTYDFSLEDHVLVTYTSLTKQECHEKCIQIPNCYSINYKEGAKCEINDATREMFPGSYRERDGWVYYAITVKPHSTVLGSGDRKLKDIVFPGNSVLLNCTTLARPPANNYEFYQDEKLVYKSISGIYTIPNVTKLHSGLYKCLPSNEFGRGEEANFNLTVKDHFKLSFPSRRTTTSYVILRNIVTSSLKNVTVCYWMRSNDTERDGTVFSYSATGKNGGDNEISMWDIAAVAIKQVDYKSWEYLSMSNDGKWHHICCTWRSATGSLIVYKDGEIAQQKEDKRTGFAIQGGGVIVLGQDQDLDGGRFERKDSFTGEITNVNMWSRAVSSEDVIKMSRTCVVGQGDVMRWSDVIGNYHNVRELPLGPCP